MDAEAILEKKYLKAQRFKTVKELENEYSKELISLYREKTEQKNQENEYRKVAEVYKKKLEEIEYLKNKKEELYENARKNQFEKEKQNLILQEYLREVERKKNEFETFMKEKGKEALSFFKKNEQTKKRLQEELHKFEDKKKVRVEAKTVAKNLVENYREKKDKEQRDLENSKPTQDNFMYKISQNFQSQGSRIDYSTTRFHNIIVMKHQEEQEKFIVSAQENAEIESEKLKVRKKSKEIAVKKFEKETKLNSKEIIRKEKAKENLNRLQEELNQINQARKKSTSKNKVLKMDTMKSKAKNMEKTSSQMMNRLMDKKMSKRNKILNKNIVEDKAEVLFNMEPIPQAEDVSEFYNDNEVEDENGREDYINNAILEFNNQQIDNKQSNFPAYGEKNIQKKTFYEEPLTREVQISEPIRRLNPVDLTSFNQNIVKSDFIEINNIHKDTKKNLRELNINDLLKTTKDNRQNISDSDTKLKASNMVLEFFNNVNMAEVGKAKKKEIEKPYLYVEPKLEAPKVKIEPKVVTKIEKKVESKFEPRKNVKPEEPEEEEKQPEVEFKRDDTKWKFNKQELAERRKKMLKDKSLIKKS